MITTRKWKIAFFTTLIISLPTVAFLGYGFVDQAVTISYMSQGYKETVSDLKRLGKIFPIDTYAKKDILVLLRQNNPDAFIVETKCRIQLNGLRFEFDEHNKLININTRAQYESEKACKNT